MIESKDISFVIQGQIGGHNIKQIEQIKTFFPDCKVIVSSSSPNIDVEADKLNANEVILNKDPGAFVYEKGIKSNLNRQLVSTLEGLKKVTTKYAFKLRADFELTGNDFLKYFESYENFDEDYMVFDHKVLACSYFSRNPKHKRDHMPFHPSDLAYFGLTSDLLKIFDIPLVSGCEVEPFIEKYQTNIVSEQYIFTSCLKACGKKIDFKHKSDDRIKNIEDTEKYFASNFVFLSYNDFNIKPQKKTLLVEIHPNAVLDCYTHNEWLEIYKKHIDNTVEIPLIDNEREYIKKRYIVYSFFSFFANIIGILTFNKPFKKKIKSYILEKFLG